MIFWFFFIHIVIITQLQHWKQKSLNVLFRIWLCKQTFFKTYIIRNTFEFNLKLRFCIRSSVFLEEWIQSARACTLGAGSFWCWSRLASCFSLAPRGVGCVCCCCSERIHSGTGRRRGSDGWCAWREGLLEVQSKMIVIVFWHFPR